jgi:enoyl-CoA hydratase/3-hydroxyacyl-CoA dehydrogenase
MMDINHIKNISIIGTGFMGHGIAQVCLLAGFEKIILNDIKIDLLKDAINKIKASLNRSDIKALFLEGISIDQLLNKLIIELDLKKAVSQADFIIEAISEVKELKFSLYQKLGEYAPKHAIIASNTSTMSITKLGNASKIPERVIGMHFFFPVVRQSCVEIMKGDNSSDLAMNLGCSVANKLPCIKGKRMIARIEKDCPGFIANRLLIPPLIYTNWIFDKAYEKGIPWEQIDADMGNIMAMGPCELTDYLGLDTTYNAMKSFEEYISPDFAPGKVLTKLVKEGNLGRKTKKGFYEWDQYGKAKIDKTKKAGLCNPEILLAIQLNEGCKLLEQDIVSGFKIIDDVMLSGTNMPGPFSAGKKNYEKWSRLLEELVKDTGKEYLKPCTLMKSGSFIKMRK